MLWPRYGRVSVFTGDARRSCVIQTKAALSSKSALSFLRQLTTCHCSHLLRHNGARRPRRSIDRSISPVPTGPQQQTHRGGLQRSIDGTDRRMDTVTSNAPPTMRAMSTRYRPPMAAKRYNDVRFGHFRCLHGYADHWVRLPACGFLLVFYSNDSPKMHCL